MRWGRGVREVREVRGCLFVDGPTRCPIDSGRATRPGGSHRAVAVFAAGPVARLSRSRRPGPCRGPRSSARSGHPPSRRFRIRSARRRTGRSGRRQRDYYGRSCGNDDVCGCDVRRACGNPSRTGSATDRRRAHDRGAQSRPAAVAHRFSSRPSHLHSILITRSA